MRIEDYYGDEDEIEAERQREREDYDDYLADHCSHGSDSYYD